MVNVKLLLLDGLGDVSWVHSRMLGLRDHFGDDLRLTYYASDETPRRAGDFINLLSGVKFGGYVKAPKNQIVQCLPPDWPTHWGCDPLTRFGMVHASVNTQLELGIKLEDIWPVLGPTEYHYDINETGCGIGGSIDVFGLEKGEHPKRVLGAYVCSMLALQNPRWQVWKGPQWVEALDRAAKIMDADSICMIGAEWDRMYTEAVGLSLQARGHKVTWCIGEPIATVCEVIRRVSFLWGYHSGISVISNVLRTPSLSLLPAHLKKMEEAYADPYDIETGRYRAWAVPTVDETIEWFEAKAVQHTK
jgi:hypothetical protein